MSFKLIDLIKNQSKLITILPSLTLKEALKIMIEHDFSQLPVVDEKGKLIGLITEQSMIRKSFNLSNGVFKLTHMVRDYMGRVETSLQDADIFDILDKLKTSYAIIVLNDEKHPIGIITHYDTSVFFREYAEDFIQVQSIEETLRDYIDVLLPNRAARQEIFDRLKANGYTIRNPDKLSLDNYIRIIIEAKETFELYFEPYEIFESIMERVRDIRNKLAHFGDDIDSVEVNALKHAIEWIENRPSLPGVEHAKPIQVLGNVAESIKNIKHTGSKYDRLKQWLQQQQGQTISVEFEGIERIIGTSLPPSARTTRNWWANDSVSRVQSIAWLSAGWRIINVNFTEQSATFQRIPQGEQHP